jgi:hypothetical protein
MALRAMKSGEADSNFIDRSRAGSARRAFHGPIQNEFEAAGVFALAIARRVDQRRAAAIAFWGHGISFRLESIPQYERFLDRSIGFTSEKAKIVVRPGRFLLCSAPIPVQLTADGRFLDCSCSSSSNSF